MHANNKATLHPSSTDSREQPSYQSRDHGMRKR